MKKLKEYIISFSGLKKGIHVYDYQISSSFFDYFGYDDFNDINVSVEVKLNKKETLLELEFSHKGFVNVPCDLTNENFDLPIEGGLELVVKFGEEFNDENEELLILPHGAYEVDVAQYIYEMIVLSIPLKRVHPSIEEEDEFGEQQNLVFFAGTEEENEIEQEQKEIDPRWSKLKDLLTDNN